MVRTAPLERLYELDKAFAVQLDKLLHDERYINQVMKLEGDELIQVVDYLSDTIRRLSYVRQSPRKCLHILHQISSIRKVLPRDYEVSGTVSSSGSNPSAYGGSSDVHRGSLSARKEDVCIKKLRMPRTGGLERINELLREEAILWKYLKHPNIVPFKGVISNPPQLVSEWMPGGELREHVKKSPSANLINLLLGVACGLEYLHSHGVIHGDLKGPNILVDASGNARITDFGLASVVREPSSVRSGTEEYGYTPRWTAPEMFLDNPIPSKESDVFSFAMVAIEVGG